MAIHGMGWRPLHCRCSFEMTWDDALPPPAAEHQPHSGQEFTITRSSVCDEHAVHGHVPHTLAHYKAVVEENQRVERVRGELKEVLGQIADGEIEYEYDAERNLTYRLRRNASNQQRNNINARLRNTFGDDLGIKVKFVAGP